MKRIEFIIFLLVSSILLMGAAKDPYDSFDNLGSKKIGLVVNDTTSLSSTLESGFNELLREVGFVVYKIDTSHMNDSTYDGGSTRWDSLDLVILCDGTFGSTTPDTSKAGGIGDVPIIVLEPSFWGEFGLPDCTGTGNNDSILVADTTNFITQIFNVNESVPISSSNQTIFFMDSSYTGSNIISLSTDSADTVAVMDTLDGQRRMAFGLPLAPDQYPGGANGSFRADPFTFIARFISETIGTNTDSLFSFAYTHGTNTSSLVSYEKPIRPWLEINGHEVWMFHEDYLDSSIFKQPRSTANSDWDSLDAVIIFDGVTSSQNSFDSLQLTTTDMPIITGDWSYSDRIFLGNVGGVWSAEADCMKVVNASSRLSNIWSLNDTLDMNVALTNRINKASWDVDALGGVALGTLVAYDVQYGLTHKDSIRWLFNGWLNAATSATQTFSDSGWSLLNRSFGWLFESFPTPPSNVTLTALNTDSMSVSWTDNSASEDNFAVMIVQPDSQYFSYPIANATIDTLFPFWPPNAEIIVDVAVVEGTDTVFSSTGQDTGYTLAAIPPAPRTDMLNDTTMLFSLDGYVFEDRFSDEEFTSDPVWTNYAGAFSVDTVYRRLESEGSNSGIISIDASDEKDMVWETMIHYNDSSTFVGQQVNWYFMAKSLSGASVDSGYRVETDDNEVELLFSDGTTSTSYIFYSNTWDYKWHTIKVIRDWTSSPFDSSVTWKLYFDGDSVGVKVENPPLFNTADSTGMNGVSHRMWFDNFLHHHITPSVNHDSTHYAVQEQNSGNYVDWRANPDTLASTTEIWGTFNEWRSTGWDTLTGLNANTSYIIRVKARNGQQ